MPVRMTWRVDGFESVRAGFREIGGENVQKACVSGTAAMSQVMKRRAIGFLRSSPSVDSGLVAENVITKKVPRSRTNLTSEHVVTVRKKDYPAQRGKSRRNTRQVAGYLEFGTVKMPAEPFLRPAGDTGKQEAIQAAINRMRQRIKRFRAA